MLAGRRFRVEFTDEQATLAEQIGAVCRAVWNTGLEHRLGAAPRVPASRGVDELPAPGQGTGRGQGGAAVAGAGAGALFAADSDGPGQSVPHAWHFGGALALGPQVGAVVPVPRGRQAGRGAAQRSAWL